jgi:hypothetical protein
VADDRRTPPQTWADLGWRDKVRLRVPDLFALGVLALIAAAVAARLAGFGRT